eukprot:TRINITY_DN61800_c0_g1_i1.p1 TRINITY_DN61800_c0_g1~~TRINITY_DN61800_c0_g1_i1.p1  ORF type:complete len:108 (-),score=16.97 TRINITY_DN61800_c0_g1_i1:21-344(-)
MGAPSLRRSKKEYTACNSRAESSNPRHSIASASSVLVTIPSWPELICSNTCLRSSLLTARQDLLVASSRISSCLLYTSRAHETPEHLVCRLLLEKKKKSYIKSDNEY